MAITVISVTIFENNGIKSLRIRKNVVLLQNGNEYYRNGNYYN